MKIVGVICEYNPFHLGHLAQLAKLRAFGPDAAVVCVMSGNFVQRGEPAVFDKFTRAAAAAACGADLVLELPVTAALSSAEGFARGGVEVLDRLGIVTDLCFGCESGGAEPEKAAQAMCGPSFEPMLRENLDSGLSYAAAKQKALETLTGISGILRRPNDILAAEYCRALFLRGSAIAPMPVLREGDYHAAAADALAPSATAVRELLASGGWEPFVPEAARPFFASAPQYRMEYGERAVLSRLRAMEQCEWQHAAHGSEGLWSKAMKASRTECGLAEIMEAVRSRRYPMTRIRRLLMCAYLGITEEELHGAIPAVRILAFGERGRELTRMARKEGSIPLLNPGQAAEDAEMQRRDERCADLYALFAEKPLPPGAEQRFRITFSEK